MIASTSSRDHSTISTSPTAKYLSVFKNFLSYCRTSTQCLTKLNVPKGCAGTRVNKNWQRYERGATICFQLDGPINNLEKLVKEGNWNRSSRRND